MKTREVLVCLDCEQASSWWSVSKEDLIDMLQVNVQSGLTQTQVDDHQSRFGPNIVEGIKLTSISRLVIEGVRQPMMLLLLSIAAISLIG